MGVMGHYVGDCAQPLHTTKHHNGWVGENPHGYTTWPGLHKVQIVFNYEPSPDYMPE